MATADKYDRQLRLWGSNGQRVLMSSHILLIGASAVGTETLKNLVLPGLGSFTILDDLDISLSDLGNNFFIKLNNNDRERERERVSERDSERERILRGKIARELLCEMNPDVKGNYVHSNLIKELEQDSQFLNKFSLVIACNPLPATSQLVSSVCWDQSIPLIIVRSYGFIGTYRFQIRGIHGIIESKPDAEKLDLRINNPFPELEEYCQRFDLSKQDSLEHSHTPYLVILYHAMNHWKAEHGGNAPRTHSEKKEFKALIQSLRSPLSSVEEMNYTEALSNVHRVYPSSHESDLDKLFSTLPPLSEEEVLGKDREKERDNLSEKIFRLLLEALKAYLSVYQQPPLKGSIPDMTSTSEHFVTLQQIFLKKAQDDRLAFTHILHELLKSRDLSTSFISPEVIDTFCKNISNLRFVRTSPIYQDTKIAAHNSETVSDIIGDPYADPKQTPYLFYVGLEAVEAFHQLHGRYPGQTERYTGDDELEREILKERETQQLEEDSEQLWSLLSSLSLLHGLPIQQEESFSISKDHAVELCRYGGVELHNISALLGGVAAQEAVKILTHLYVPLANTFIFNGIAGVGGNYNL